MNMKIWHAIEVEIARVGEAAATAQLWAMNTTGVEVSEDASDFVTLRAYFDTEPDVEKLRQQILANLKQLDLPEFALRRIEASSIADQDWMSEWKKGWEPLLIGQRLVIAPSWKLDQVTATDRVVIQIDPGMAFGTGTHETTRGCLEMLEKAWPSNEGSASLLDVGTGTGILAIAAFKLLAPDAQTNSRITAFDVDPEAIEVARENAEINQVADNIEIEVNKLSSYAGQEFDVVLANLTADVIIPLAADFPAAMKPAGTLIVSGILREQGEDVVAALSVHNFELIESKPDGEWVTMTFRLSM
ncbi:MAG TPA: 50S ribosomal protein L11 methyltransferase [Blastocatellia bacterium]|nr:50S ribosomal protein L11 methyltransferase [Blastocatellia bacterium]